MSFRLALAVLFCLASAAPGLAQAPQPQGVQPQDAAAGEPPKTDIGQPDARHHALSLMGDVKYPADFKHFDYVNPAAPKGGSVRIAAVGTFDSLNPVLYRGVPAAGIGLVNEQLMYDSLEEPSTMYGLLAEWASYPSDFSSVTFKLNDKAKWQDGEPVTPEDVIWSLGVIKEASPRLGFYYKNVTRAEKTGDNQVTFFFDVKNNRELPMIMGQLTVLPKHWWTAKDAAGNPRDPLKTTLEPPLGSGPYRVKEAVPGRTVVYERVADYWGKDLPVNAGHYNFDELRFEYFRDDTVAFEAFKAGNVDYRTESSAKNWATAYEFDAIRDGRVKKQAFETRNARPMQAFVLNTRRAQLQDPRVRRAFNLAFDFEWANKNLFYDQYKRTSSYFEGTELAATGLPEGRELEILNAVKDQVPPEMFTTPVKMPVNNSREDVRDHLREATDLLQQAGWTVRTVEVEDPDCGMVCQAAKAVGLGAPKTARVLRNAKDEPFRVEFLLVQPDLERVVQPYAQSLARLGIEASIRIVDPAQYSRRLDTFDYDIITASFPQSESPGNEQRDFWGSDAAKRDGSQNLIGIQNPAVDTLIDRLIFATDRADLVAATKALDRVLLWNTYVVPQWFSPTTRVAWWNKYDHPETLPAQTVAFLQVWWSAPDGRQAAADQP